MGERERICRSRSDAAVCSSSMAGILMTRALCGGGSDLQRHERVRVSETAFRQRITRAVQVIFSESLRRRRAVLAKETMGLTGEKI